MNPNKFQAIRALHVFRAVVEELATNCASPLVTTEQREVGLFLLESAADVAHAAYALYQHPQDEACAQVFENILRKADEFYAAHTTMEYQPYRMLLENAATNEQALDADAGTPPVLQVESSGTPQESVAWYALQILLQDVDQTVAFGLAADLEPADLLILFVGLQLPAAIVRCAFEVLNGEGEEGDDVDGAIEKYNTLLQDALRIRQGLSVSLTILDYPTMPALPKA